MGPTAQFWTTISTLVIAAIAILAFIDNRTDSLRSEINAVRTDFREELASVRTELHEDVGSVRSEVHTLRGDMRTDFNDMRDRIETLQQTAATTDSRLSRIESDIEALTSSLATAQGDITELQKTNTDTITAISKLDGGLNAIKEFGLVDQNIPFTFVDTDKVPADLIAPYAEVVKRLKEAGVDVKIVRQASMGPYTRMVGIWRDVIGHQSYFPIVQYTPPGKDTENNPQLPPRDNPAGE